MVKVEAGGFMGMNCYQANCNSYGTYADSSFRNLVFFASNLDVAFGFGRHSCHALLDSIGCRKYLGLFFGS